MKPCFFLFLLKVKYFKSSLIFNLLFLLNEIIKLTHIKESLFLLPSVGKFYKKKEKKKKRKKERKKERN